MSNVKVIGDKALNKQLKKLSDPEKTFDPVFQKETRTFLRQVIKENPRLTGDTARAWTTKRIGESFYSVFNNKTTADRRHNVVDILNDGRGVVRPIRAKKLYIPLTNKGRSKPIGAPIPKSLKFGVDYILADKAGPYKGTKFLDKEVDQSGERLTKRIIDQIGRL